MTLSTQPDLDVTMHLIAQNHIVRSRSLIEESNDIWALNTLIYAEN
jgi:hypothetical protein